jgi:hypothetical protein
MSRKAIIPCPKKPKQPSVRDEAIFRAHTVDHVPQVKLAFENKMSASRVSQIVGNVRAWWADRSPRDGELDHGQRVRLERRLERERLEMLYGESLKLLREWEGEAGQESGEELQNANCKMQIANLQSGEANGVDAASPGSAASATAPSPRPSRRGRGSRRDHASQRVQALKCAIRTTESLGKLAERKPAPEPAGGKQLRHDHLFGDLMRRRKEAEEEGLVPPTAKPDSVVYYVLRAMTGEPLNQARPGSDLQAAVADIVATLVRVGGLEVGQGRQGGTSQANTGSVGNPGSAEAVGPARQAGSTETASAKVANVEREALLAGCPEDVKEILAASGWPDRFYDQLQADAAALAAATLAREKGADFSAAAAAAAESQVQSPRSEGESGPTGEEVGVAHSRNATEGVPYSAPGGIEVVGSPEWQVARNKWLADRDRRRIEEARRKSLDDATRAAEIRAIRAAAAQRRAWLDAGRVEW